MRTLAATAAALAAGAVTAEVLTRAALDRLMALDPMLHVIAALDPDRALDQARAADARRRAGASLGPLDGIPLAHKDLFWRAGRPAASGSRALAAFVPTETAHVIERLDDAGAVDLGRLAMVEIALGPTGLNPEFGTPRNPWNPHYVTGGSSSGPACAVAAGLVFGALGSDTGGSIRTPASCCGVVGLKPTFGRVSRRGVLPLSISLDHVGPIARTVADAALLFAAIAGDDPRDPWSAPGRVGHAPDPAGLRLGVPRDLAPFRLDPEIAALCRTSVEVLRDLGVTIVTVDLDWFDDANVAVNIVLAAEAAALWRAEIERTPCRLGTATRERLLPGLAYRATDYIDALRLRTALLEGPVAALFSEVDALHLPVLPVPVPTIAEAETPGAVDYVAFAYPSRAINLLGLPAIALPMGLTRNGLPAGMQLVGPPWSDEFLLALGMRYEAANGLAWRLPSNTRPAALQPECR